MLNKIIFSFILTFLLFYPLNSYSQEHQLDGTNIKVNIPDNYTVVTKNIIPSKTLKDLQLTEKEILEMLSTNNALLYCYNLDNFTEIYFVYNISQDSKSVGDFYLLKDDDFNNELLTLIKNGTENKFNWSIDDYKKLNTYNAKYIELKAHPNNDKSIYIKSYVTIKDGASFGINGLSYSGNNTALDLTLNKIINNVVYINNPVTANNSYNNKQLLKQKEKDNKLFIKKATIKGISSAIIVIITLSLLYLIKSLLEKRKANHTPSLLDALILDLHSLPNDKFYLSDLDNIIKNFKSSTNLETFNNPSSLYRSFEIELYNSIFEAGFIYRGILNDLGNHRRIIHYNFLSLCVSKGYLTQEEANQSLQQLNNTIQNMG